MTHPYEPQQQYIYPPVQQPPAGIGKRIRRHIWAHFFTYCFLAVQAIFLIWVIGGAASGSGNGADAHAEAVKFCANGGWQYLYHSQAECVTQYGNTLTGAGDIGTGIGVGIIIAFWVAVDVILGIGRIVVVLGRRHKGGHRA